MRPSRECDLYCHRCRLQTFVVENADVFLLAKMCDCDTPLLNSSAQASRGSMRCAVERVVRCVLSDLAVVVSRVTLSNPDLCLDTMSSRSSSRHHDGAWRSFVAVALSLALIAPCKCALRSALLSRCRDQRSCSRHSRCCAMLAVIFGLFLIARLTALRRRPRAANPRRTGAATSRSRPQPSSIRNTIGPANQPR